MSISANELTITVTGNFVNLSRDDAGASGEANRMKYNIHFDSSWIGYSKRIIWRDANGKNPTSVILYNQLTAEPDSSEIEFEDLTIPAEPLSIPGKCSFTIEGYSASAGSIAKTVTASLFVRPSESDAPNPPTPPEALQLQSEIEGLLHTVRNELKGAVSGIYNWQIWDANATYPQYSRVVVRDGNGIDLYYCKKAVMEAGISPESDTEHWTMLAENGAPNGDMIKNIYDTENRETDVFNYIDAVSAGKVPLTDGKISRGYIQHYLEPKLIKQSKEQTGQTGILSDVIKLSEDETEEYNKVTIYTDMLSSTNFKFDLPKKVTMDLANKYVIMHKSYDSQPEAAIEEPDGSISYETSHIPSSTTSYANKIKFIFDGKRVTLKFTYYSSSSEWYIYARTYNVIAERKTV